jgi:predicted transcriptional regulator
VVATANTGRPRGVLEREVIACVAAAEHPLTPAEVLAELDGGLAYTTVMTTLGRLHAKGALVREVDGRAYRYALAATVETLESSLTARQMRRLLEAGTDRAGVLARFVADLEPDDERLLVELLKTASPAAEQP